MGVDLKPFIKDAQELEKKTGIPAAITLGQIALESGGKYAGGLSGLAAQGKNLFGIKGQGTAGGIIMPTTEYYNGMPKTIQAMFKKYNSFYESMVDHYKVLSLPRYQTYLKDAKTIDDFANGIAKGGYATDPNYANQLLKVIKDNGLDKYSGKDFKYNPDGGFSENIEFKNPSSGTDKQPDKKDDSKMTFVQDIFNGTTRFIVLILAIVLMFVFFFKAFPAVEDVATSAVPAAKGLKVAKKLAK